MELELLDHIVQGQAERNILNGSIKGYLSKCKVMTHMLYSSNDLRLRAIEHDENGEPIKHTGMAKDVYKLKFPITVEIGQYLFALISVDPSLPRRKRGRQEIETNANGNEEHETNRMNPAAKQVTVSAQTYQNYKSALKWWHRYNSPEMGKIGYEWPAALEEAIVKAIGSYKRDIAVKKRSGVMDMKEGKSPYDLNGYIEITRHLTQMQPEGNKRHGMKGFLPVCLQYFQ